MNIPTCEKLIARDQKVIAPCQHLSYFPLGVAKHQGAIITDLDGNEYIDFLASASSLNLGGSHPVITRAIQEQLTKFTQYIFAYTYNEQTVAYGERLTSVYPGGVKAKIAFGNCGSDANDCAVKFARAYTGREKIAVFKNAYHGNTYCASTMTTCCEKMHNKMGPFLPGIYAFPFYGTDQDDATVERDCLQDLEAAFASYMPAEDVAAIVIEPIQGDGGILPAHPIFMKKLYQLCKDKGILFISEEVQQGFWRTGKWFSIEHYGIVPDGIIMGKSVGAGLVLGAFMAPAEIMDCLPGPAHAFTLGGNSVACAAGIAAFDYYKTEEFQFILQRNTEVLEAEAEKLKTKYPDAVEFVRNVGMSMGIGFYRRDEQGNRVHDGKMVYKILYRCFEKGLILMSLIDYVLRIQPPLVITPEQIQRGFSILGEAIEDYQAGRIGDEVLEHQVSW